MASEVIWRDAVPDDVPKLRELHAAREAALGSKMDFPADLFAFPVIMAAVLERDPEIIGCMVFSITAEVELISNDPAFLRYVLNARERFLPALKAQGFPLLHAFVPKEVDMEDGMTMGKWANLSKHFTHYATLTKE